MHHRRVVQEKNRLIQEMRRLKKVCMCVYVCMCMYVCVCMYVRMYVCMYVRMCVYGVCNNDNNKMYVLRLWQYYQSFGPALRTLKKKYEGAMKKNMLIGLDRDKLKSKVCVCVCVCECSPNSSTATQPPQP